MHFLPPTLLTLLYTLTPTCASSPSPPLLTTDHAISLWPRHTLFYRQVSDLQTFSGALGGVRASSITNSGTPDRPFSVGGNTFPDFATAAQRSCDEQFQGCQKGANASGGGGGGKGKRSGEGNGNGNGNGDGKKDGNGNGDGKRDGGVTVAMCDAQKDQCNQAQQTAKVQDFNSPTASTNIGPDPEFPDFDLICEG